MKLFEHSIGRELFGAVLATALLVSAVSCVTDKQTVLPDNGRRRGEVRLGAYVEDVAETRAQSAEYINTGTYYMTYPNPNPNNDTHSVCTVNFHDGFGVTTTVNNKELKWEEVGSLTYSDVLTNFFLDNVAPPDGNPNATEIFFTEEYHPFDAAVYKGDGKENDLLWGYAFVDLFTSNEINIGIHHYLSRVSVVVTVDNTLENAQELDFRNGSVKITNVVKKGISYNRTNGSISLGAAPQYEELELAAGGDWASVREDENEPNIFYYQTQNFVIPPQGLRTDERRPRLVLEVPQPDGSRRTYSGIIPRVMMVDGSPATMAFDPEKNLTLRVKISQDQLRIESIVAYVQDWVDKGSFLISANGTGIFDSKQFMDLVGLYPTGSYEQLKEFGYRDTAQSGTPWNFNIFTNLTLNVEDVKSVWAAPAPDFVFDMTTYRLILVYKDGTKRMFGSYEPSDHDASAKAAKILHDLLRDGTVPDPSEGADPDANGGGNGDGEGDMNVGTGR